LSNKTVIVTGASRGLGEETAKILAEHGASVVLTARSETDLRRVSQALESAGGTAHALPGDVSQSTDCERIVQETLSRFGRIDAIINNAGMLHPIASIAEGDPATWAQNIAVNLLGPYYLTHYALPQLRANNGRVITVSSGSALRPDVGWSAYCAAKAGVNLFMRSVAAEEPTITAIAYRPGKLDTPMQATIREDGLAGMPPEIHAQFISFYENGELLPPRESGLPLAALALYAPIDWSGEFVAMKDERLQAIVTEKFGAS
jgi:NAD(P)-dependent dehydrogenase (short-subunit alcohol dehydrogenase family)